MATIEPLTKMSKIRPEENKINPLTDWMIDDISDVKPKRKFDLPNRPYVFEEATKGILQKKLKNKQRELHLTLKCLDTLTAKT